MATISSDDYVIDGGNHCPNCKSDEITTGSMHVDSGIAWQYCTCDQCDMEWNDQYKLIGYNPID